MHTLDSLCCLELEETYYRVEQVLVLLWDCVE